MTLVKPEAVGFSSERLKNLRALIQGEIDRRELAGSVIGLAGAVDTSSIKYRAFCQLDSLSGAAADCGRIPGGGDDRPAKHAQ
jgi:hypothetical protein